MIIMDNGLSVQLADYQCKVTVFPRPVASRDVTRTSLYVTNSRHGQLFTSFVSVSERTSPRAWMRSNMAMKSVLSMLRTMKLMVVVPRV